MATLTDTSILARRAIRYGVYIVIIIIITRFTFRTALSAYQRLFPPPLPDPTVGFDKLPKLPFPDKLIPDPIDVSYKLETVEGELPELPTQTAVYFMSPITASLNAEDEAREKAQRLGFDPEGKEVVENVPNIFIFSKTNVPAQLTMNIISGNFSMSYDLNSDPTAIGGVPPDPKSAISQTLSVLIRTGSFPEDIDKELATHSFLHIKGGKFVKAISQSEADLIKVNLFRQTYKDIPSVTPLYPEESNVWFIYGSSTGSRENVIAAEYHYYSLDEDKSETYPLITSKEAWEKLKSGSAYISNFGDNEQNITIRNIYVAYYDPGQYAEFYQPVVVFEGDNNFAAFVPAVTDEFYGGVNQELKSNETPNTENAE